MRLPPSYSATGLIEAQTAAACNTHSGTTLFMLLAACTSCAYVLVARHLRPQSVFARGMPVVQRQARNVKVASLEGVSTPGAREHEVMMLLLPGAAF